MFFAVSCGVVAAPGGASAATVGVLLPFLLRSLRGGDAKSDAGAGAVESDELVTACLVITGAMTLSTHLAPAAVEALVSAVAGAAGSHEAKARGGAAAQLGGGGASPRLRHALTALVAL